MVPISEVPAICAVCRRQGGPRGLKCNWTGRRYWVCNDPECNDAIVKVMHMSIEDMRPIEKHAVCDAAQAGGKYLEGLGRYNMTELTGDEFFEFVERIIDGFQCGLRARLVPNG